MCTAVHFSNRVLYAILVRLIISFRITQSEEMPPNIDYINYKEDSTASSATPLDFKALFVPRDKESLERCMKQCQDQSSNLMKEESELPI